METMSVAQNLACIKETLPENVTLVAVSKFHPEQVIREAYDAGQRVFGESRVQELCRKRLQLPGDIHWHFIGSLQTNKVKDIAPFIELIHSVDSLKLLKEIDKQAAKNNRVINVLLEIHVAQEPTKHGLTPEESVVLLKSEEFKSLRHVRMCGIMGMATNTDDETVVRQEFHRLHELFVLLANECFPSEPSFSILSMGMSHDYRLAVEEGSTMVRIGTDIFGEREY